MSTSNDDVSALHEFNISVDKLSRDLRIASYTLGNEEARYLVDSYYQMQKDRIRADLRVQKLVADKSSEPHDVLKWLHKQSDTLEKQIKAALDKYSSAHPVGVWMKSQKGVGPIIASGYLSRVDMTRTHMQTIGGLWAHCGVSPGRDRKVKGQVIMYNPQLKRLTFLLGECFKRLSPDSKDAYYRHIYDKRKAYETTKNEAGDYAEQAKLALSTKNFSDDTKALTFYSKGQLPPGHIDMRCCRYAAKMFLAHLHEVWWYHLQPTVKHPYPYPLPYPVAHMDHVKIIPPPNFSKPE